MSCYPLVTLWLLSLTRWQLSIPLRQLLIILQSMSLYHGMFFGKYSATETLLMTELDIIPWNPLDGYYL